MLEHKGTIKEPSTSSNIYQTFTKMKGNLEQYEKIHRFEPWFFMFFGIFHLHRIWGIIDRNSYAEFWINVMESRGIFYFALIGIYFGADLLLWVVSCLG